MLANYFICEIHQHQIKSFITLALLRRSVKREADPSPDPPLHSERSLSSGLLLTSK